MLPKGIFPPARVVVFVSLGGRVSEVMVVWVVSLDAVLEEPLKLEEVVPLPPEAWPLELATKLLELEATLLEPEA